MEYATRDLPKFERTRRNSAIFLEIKYHNMYTKNFEGHIINSAVNAT